MKSLRVNKFAVLFYIFAVCFFCNFLQADTIRLTNGRVIHGDIQHDKTDSTKYVIIFGNGGKMWVNKKEVVSVEEND